MKKQSLLLSTFIVIGLVILSNCNNGGKCLTFYQDNGNFVVSDNYLVQSAMPMAYADIQQLISLDTAYAKLTQGKCFLLTTTTKLQVLKSGQIRFLDKVTDRKYFDNSKYFVDLTVGCFEKQQIDWAQYGDLKVRLDAILTKYNPATINGNISITNNQIATSAKALKDTDIATLVSMSKISNAGIFGYDICPPDGSGKINRLMRKVGDGILDKNVNVRLENVLQSYNVAQGR
jgi:hypothetical protein